ncbi:hypothetical protein TrST_g5639 [Triparma strigata]|uniref:Uncharacterized protein n=1 Tax=Triparma strigata TaxID=1606541 RepID=A0A9W7DZD9_9STRA|nr:hypothetical protein TrST_g5639 [Triparma strigata]
MRILSFLLSPSLFLDLRNTDIAPSIALTSLESSLKGLEYETPVNPLLDAMAIGAGGALEGVDVSVGGLESVDDAQLTSGPTSLIDGCLTLGEQGSLKCVLTNSGRLRWKAANTTFMNVYEMQDQMNPNEVLKAVSAMSLDQVVLANGGNEGGSDAVDVLLGSSMRGKVIMTVDDKFGAEGVFTAMAQLRTFNGVESTSEGGILLGSSSSDTGSYSSRSGIAIGLDHGMWRRAVEIRDSDGDDDDML